MTSNPETGALNWGYFLIIYLVFTIITAGFQGISGNIVIPMTADCADYEVYRTGKYVPGQPLTNGGGGGLIAPFCR